MICLGELILSDTVDDWDRGPYTIIESTAVDGNVADVYGEFPEESAANARAIVDGINELAALRAEVTRLTAELAAARGEHVWSKMGELGLATMCLDWEIGRVFAFNTDGDMVADKETIQEVFDSLS